MKIKQAYHFLTLASFFLGSQFFFYPLIHSEVITVNSSLDDPAAQPAVNPLTSGGVVTLRSAIEYANAVGGPNTINFNLTGQSPFTIEVGTGSGVNGQSFPVITSQLTINGDSQTRENSIFPIIVDGTSVTTGEFQNGLTLIAGSNNSKIRGLQIQHFPHHGVLIDTAVNNSILSNSIFDNKMSGINLINNGNNNLSVPILTSATISGTTLIVSGNFSSQDNPDSQFIIQFFTNPTADNVAEGQLFVGQITLTTDATGNGTFSDVPFFSNAVAGQFVSATITLLNAMGAPLSTSEFSENFIIAQGEASGTIDAAVTFDTFPGIRAQSVVIDSKGRVLVGGLDGAIVRYTADGALDLTYELFPGVAISAMVIDSNDNIIAVGDAGYVVAYNSNGIITLTYDAFPGLKANAVIFDQQGDIIVGGLQSTIARYSTSGVTAGRITQTFNPFPGTEVNGLALNSSGEIIACGLQGKVVRYTSMGVIVSVYETFPGLAANAVIVDANDQAIVVGKTKTTTTITSSVGAAPVVSFASATNVIRYNADGTINLTFAPFQGLDAQHVMLDLNGNIIVCGLESLIVQYNPNTGNINFSFANFSGISATWMALTAANEIIVVGWQGDVVRYFN